MKQDLHHQCCERRLRLEFSSGSCAGKRLQVGSHFCEMGVLPGTVNANRDEQFSERRRLQHSLQQNSESRKSGFRDGYRGGPYWI